MLTKIIVFPAYKRLILSYGIAIVKKFFKICLSNANKEYPRYVRFLNKNLFKDACEMRTNRNL